MSDLLALDEINDKIYVHSGITATIRNSFAAPAVNGKGIMMETSGGNLVTVDVVTAKLYTHSGISATISSSFALTTVVPINGIKRVEAQSFLFRPGTLNVEP